MRKSLFAAIVIVAGTLLAGCSGGASNLTGKVWFLTAGTQQNPTWQWALPLADQLRYTITFNTDGTFAAKADCNQLGGSYKTSGTDGLTITPTVSTMAYCGEQSLDTLYVQALGTTTNYKATNDQLTLTLKSGGTMSFTSVKTTASAAPTESPAEVPAGSPGSQALTGKEWQLTAVTEKVPAFQGVVPPANQGSYTITFNADKTFSAKADCNNVAGTYETTDPAAASGPLNIKPGPMTLAACPEGSYGDLFIVGLASAHSYAIENDQLTINLVDGGTLGFK